MKLIDRHSGETLLSNVSDEEAISAIIDIDYEFESIDDWNRVKFLGRTIEIHYAPCPRQHFFRFLARNCLYDTEKYIILPEDATWIRIN